MTTRLDVQINLSKHPLLAECHDLTQAIEACGCSEQLTAATIKASALLQHLANYISESDELLDMWQTKSKPARDFNKLIPYTKHLSTCGLFDGNACDCGLLRLIG